MTRLKLIALLWVVGSVLGGCTGHAERFKQGLQWHLSNEEQKRDLNNQGFPQYTTDY